MIDPGTSFVPEPPALPGQPGGLAGRFSVREVAELAALLGLTPPVSITNLVRSPVPGGARDQSDVVRQGLFARGVLQVDADEQLIMDDDAVAIVTTICTPDLVVTVSTGRAHAPQRRTIYSRPGGGILETARTLRGEKSMHYLSLPNQAILPSLLQWTGLASQPAPPRVPAADRIPVRSANAVTVLHRPGGLLTVRLIAWNDCGARGLWQVQQDDARVLYGRQSSGLAGQPADHDLRELDEPVDLSPISADGVTELIVAALPS